MTRYALSKPRRSLFDVASVAGRGPTIGVARAARKNVQTARAVLNQILRDRIAFTPVGVTRKPTPKEADRLIASGYEFECPTRV